MEVDGKNSAMGIRFTCPNGHQLNVKEHLAGKRGICPACGAAVLIPTIAGSPLSAGSSSQVISTPPHNTATAASAGPPSVVIPVTETPAKPAQTVATPGIRPRPPSQPVLPVQAEPPIAIAPPSPVSKYQAHRARARRNQTTIAVVLLITVIVLAVALVYVLNSGPASSQTQGGLITPFPVPVRDRERTYDFHAASIHQYSAPIRHT
jgi:hypothetical protein